MDREDRNRKQNNGRNTHERNEGSGQEGDADDDLSDDCDPNHNVRQRDTRPMENASERFWPLEPFRQTVCQKSITNNQSKGNRSVGRKLRPDIPPIQPIQQLRKVSSRPQRLSQQFMTTRPFQAPVQCPREFGERTGLRTAMRTRRLFRSSLPRVTGRSRLWRFFSALP